MSDCSDPGITPEELREMLGISITTVYELLKTGRIRAIRTGRMWMIPRREVEQLLSVGTASQVSMQELQSKKGGNYAMDPFDKRIIGYDAAKETLRQILDTLKRREVYEANGATVPRGLLLVSDPGLGKTTMVKAFIEASGRQGHVFRRTAESNDFLDEIKEAFQTAKEKAPSILVLEDMNLYADGPSALAPYWACLQSCIDAYLEEDIFVIGTTNSTRHMPESMIRAGRFDYKLELYPPTGEEAMMIAEHYLKGRNLGPDVKISDMVKAMGRVNCATLETAIKIAAAKSIYHGDKLVGKQDLTDAILHLVYNLDELRNEERPGERMELVACHEAAHLVAAELQKPGLCRFATLRGNQEGRGGMCGINLHSVLYTQEDVMTMARVYLAGKAGVELVYGEVDIGVENDIQNAQNLVVQWVRGIGGAGLSGVHYEDTNESQAYLAKNEEVVAAKMEELYNQTRKLLCGNLDFLRSVQKALLEHETLLRSDINAIQEKVRTGTKGES